jgi:hypothetical protein
VSLAATSPLCLIYANKEEDTVSQNTTIISGGAFYLGFVFSLNKRLLQILQLCFDLPYLLPHLQRISELINQPTNITDKN